MAAAQNRYSSRDRSGNHPSTVQQPQQHQADLYGHHGRDSFYGDQQAASGGYNFQRIMDDHFEHYRRPPSRPASREASVDRIPTHLAEAARGGSRPASRPPSRTRTPMLQRTARMTSVDDSRIPVPGSAGSNSDHSSGLRFRGASGGGAPAAAVAPSQEIHNMGTVPKRTESLYMKYGDTDKVKIYVTET